MLNQEGWTLLLILIGFLCLLGIGFSQMGKDRNVAQPPSVRQVGALSMGVRLSAALLCVTALTVLPGAVFLNGVWGALLGAGMGIGATLTLCLVLPRLYDAGGKQEKSIAEFVAQGEQGTSLWTRRVFGGIGALVQCLAAAAGIAFLARLFAGVFSLHYMISLAAAMLLCLLLSLLCGVSAQKKMEPFVLGVFFAGMLGLLAVPLLRQDQCVYSLQTILSTAFSHVENGLPHALNALAALCWAFGAPGLVTVLQMGMSAKDVPSLRQGGRMATAMTWLGLLLASTLGLLGRMMEDTLAGQAATETILLQMAQSALLPGWCDALLLAALATAAMWIVLRAATAFGRMAALDVLGSAERTTQEKPVLRTIALCTLVPPVLGALLSTDMTAPILYAVEMACLLCGAGTGVGVLLKLFVPSVSAKGRLWAMLTGAGCAVVWMLLPWTRSLGMLGMVPCIALAVLAAFAQNWGRKTSQTAEGTEE